MQRVQTVEDAVARRVRELRAEAGVSQDGLARACQRAGMQWQVNRVGQLETARVTVTPGVLLGLARAFAELLDREVRLAELLPEGVTLNVTGGWEVPAEEVREALLGQPEQPPRRSPAPVIGTVPDPLLDPGWGQVEDRVAAELGGPEFGSAILHAARRLYGRTGTQERDGRAGEGATPQKRGRITRVLVKELVEAVEADIAREDG